MTTKKLKIALVGNPNIGKTTLFNRLCGLTQKTGNYPGVTVDKKRGKFTYDDTEFEVIDLPGINSLYPKSKDEELVINYLENFENEDYPDKIIVTVSALHLKRNLYLFHQIKDLEIPVVLAINMTDIAEKRGIFVDEKAMSALFQCPVIKVSAKTGMGFDDLKETLFKEDVSQPIPVTYTKDFSEEELSALQLQHDKLTKYHCFLAVTNHQLDLEGILDDKKTTPRKLRIDESILRYKHIRSYFDEVVKIDTSKAVDFTSKADRILLHPVWGYLIFLLVMFTIFQSLFVFASYPMDWIDQGINWLAESSKNLMPAGYFNDLITDGIIPGIGGVVIFIPQIAILFLFFSFLEESGYMSRIVFLMDKMMQRFGMSGKSVVPLMSSFACAIPGILASRTIENKKERLITIMVSPLLTCSARLPVYVVLISLIVPDEFYGPFSLQGLVMTGMYLLGIFTSLLAAMVFKWILKGNYKSTLLLEMPQYLWPNGKNILIKMWENVSSFVVNAGKIILASSVILFVLATQGGAEFDNAYDIVKNQNPPLTETALDNEVKAFQLENSYLGQLGKTIEPTIEPLGYDWKIGIALISSLAAREVFVSTMSTIYSIKSDENLTIINRLKQEKKPGSNALVFNFATSISLLLFYAFSLQCLSTVAVTYKETKSLKWTIIQFAYMSIFAYLASLTAYQLLS
ncbi:MAG: ferrous iron transport protein B [Putridiphycobacter sp.]